MSIFELGDFPWKRLASYREQAAAHPLGMVDLSVGSPVDSTPEAAQQALMTAADAPSYPTVPGTPELQQAMREYLWHSRGVAEAGLIIPTVGSKELVGLLPFLLGLGAGDAVVCPQVAYPTYRVGAVAVGADVVAADIPELWPENTRLVWINSPGNPAGGVLSAEQLRHLVAEARRRGVVLASDECYAEFLWEPKLQTAPVLGSPSVLRSAVTDGDISGLLLVQSLSKQSNLAGYRFGILAGDSRLMGAITERRQHLGLMVPLPIQAAAVAALRDSMAVERQREIYARRRGILKKWLQINGYGFPELGDKQEDNGRENNLGGIYLWVRSPGAASGASCWEGLEQLARRGVLAAPGEFYGAPEFIRFALTAPTSAFESLSLR